VLDGVCNPVRDVYALKRCGRDCKSRPAQIFLFKNQSVVLNLMALTLCVGMPERTRSVLQKKVSLSSLREEIRGAEFPKQNFFKGFYRSHKFPTGRRNAGIFAPRRAWER
jgi:hypothetical protein